MLGAVGVQPRERQAVAARELDEPSRRLGRMRPDDLDTDTVPRLQPFPARHERPEQQIAERAVVEQKCSQFLALDGDVAQRLGHDGREEDGLSREQVRLAEEAARAVAVDLRTGLVEDGRLALDDRDQRIASVADPKEHIADLRMPFLAMLGERGELSLGEHGRPGCHARTLFARGYRFLLVNRPELASGLDPEVVEFIHGGVAVGVATRDDDLRPEFARGWGPQVSADGRSLTLCVAAPEGSQMRTNLE